MISIEKNVFITKLNIFSITQHIWLRKTLTRVYRLGTFNVILKRR